MNDFQQLVSANLFPIGLALVTFYLMSRLILRKKDTSPLPRPVHSGSSGEWTMSSHPQVVANFEVMRAMQAEFDTRLARLEGLLKLADQRIEQLSSLAASEPKST